MKIETQNVNVAACRFYAAQGYEKPYRWAHFADVPFAPLPKPLAQCRVALVTTGSPAYRSAGCEPS